MNKFLKVFSITVVSLFLLSVFGWMSSHITKGDKNFGFLTGPVKFMVSFPDLFSQSVEEVKSLPGTFIPTPEDFQSINRLDEDLLALSTFSDTGKTRSIILWNLRDDSIHHKWTVENPWPEDKRIKNPLMLDDKSLVFSFNVSGLRRIDSLANIIWKQDSISPHHSVVPDSKGDVWICSQEPVYYATGMYKVNGRSVFYTDDYITKIDPESGHILFHKSVTEILAENNISNYLLKSTTIIDPLHLNDVEPAMKTTRYYNEGDVFISSRNLSLVLHYRPATNTLIDVIEGPFISQHDVDFLNDSTLVIFNNNWYNVWSSASKNPPPDSSRLTIAGDFYSNIVSYDLGSRSFSFIGDPVLRQNRIFSGTEGLVEFLEPSTYFLEEQNSGLLWVVKDNEVTYKNVLASQHEGYHHLPNWTRIIQNHE